MLVPGLEYTFEIQVECISDLGISDQLHVFVTRDQVNKCRTICIVSTILIKMSENLIDADDATYSGSREEIYGTGCSIWIRHIFYLYCGDTMNITMLSKVLFFMKNEDIFFVTIIFFYRMINFCLKF